MNGDAASIFPDQASLFHVHEVVHVTNLQLFALGLNDGGFTLGASYDLNALSVEWADLEAIAAFPFASRFRIAYRHVGGLSCREYRVSLKQQTDFFVSQAERLFNHIEQHRPHRVFRGWLDLPPLGWTGAATWPSPTGIEITGYRSNARSDRLLCEVRDQTTSFDRFMLFMRYGSDDYQNYLGDFALSQSFLYRRFKGRIETVPRAALRLRRQSLEGEVPHPYYDKRIYQSGFIRYRTERDDWLESPDGKLEKMDEPVRVRPDSSNLAIYTFGRNLNVFLYEPDTNPVALELDKQLFRQQSGE